MSTRIYQRTSRTVNFSIIPFAEPELSSLDKICGIIDRMQWTMMKEIQIKEQFKDEKDRRPVLEVELRD